MNVDLREKNHHCKTYQYTNSRYAQNKKQIKKMY